VRPHDLPPRTIHVADQLPNCLSRHRKLNHFGTSIFIEYNTFSCGRTKYDQLDVKTLKTIVVRHMNVTAF